MANVAGSKTLDRLMVRAVCGAGVGVNAGTVEAGIPAKTALMSPQSNAHLD